MIYDQTGKPFRRFLRRLSPDELVQAAQVHKCRYWHADLKKLTMKEERRKERVEKDQWGTWEDDKAQLYMDTHDMSQKHLLETASDLAKASCDEDDRETPELMPMIDVVEECFWQMPIEGRKKAIHKAKMAIHEEMMSRITSHPGQPATGPATSVAPSSH